MVRVLVVDNEASILSVLSTLLKAEGYDVVAVRDGQKAVEHLMAEDFDLMISDIRMSPMDGMELLKVARETRPSMGSIMLTAYGSIETAIEAMKMGAFDYVSKPFKVDELLVTVQRALKYRQTLAENIDLKTQIRTQYRLENIVAESSSMKAVCEMIERVAPTDASVLIYGESGTGKELVAKAIHVNSRRKSERFLAVNCAALPEPLLESEMFGHVKGAFTGATSNKKGLFEAVGNGTIFLDEIGSMPLSIQGKLLRVLQEKEIRRVGGNDNVAVNARVVAATNSRLDELIKNGLFREDLYYRLNVIPINIEPLRRRREDIMPLARHIIRKEMGEGREMPIIVPEVCDILHHYEWPGNIRELENVIKHALTFAVGNRITPGTLPPKILAAVGRMDGSTDVSYADPAHRVESLKIFTKKIEQEYLQQVLAVVGGDKEQAASALKISIATLYRKLPKEVRRKLEEQDSSAASGGTKASDGNSAGPASAEPS